MSTEVKLRRGSTAQHSTFTGALAEVTVDTDKKILVVHDGATAGGSPLARADSAISRDGPERVLMGGLIQASDSSGWEFVNDVGHEPSGFVVNSVTQSATSITVSFDFPGSKVRTLIAAPDDAYARRGLTVGCSIGLNTATLNLGMPLAAGVRYDTVNGHQYYGDPAVVDGMSMVDTAGSLLLTHNLLSDALTQPVVGAMRGGWNGSALTGNEPMPGNLAVGGATTTAFDVRNTIPLSGVVRWVSGTTFAVDSDCMGTFSATWNGTTNTMTVTHPRSYSLFDLGLAPLGYVTVISNITATGFQVQFKNDAGVLQTTPNQYFSFSFGRSSSVSYSKVFPNRYFSFSRGYVRVNPNKLYGGTGGILLFGVINTE